MTLGKIPVVCPATPVLGPLKVLPTLPGTDGSWETAALVPFVQLLKTMAVLRWLWPVTNVSNFCNMSSVCFICPCLKGGNAII